MTKVPVMFAVVVAVAALGSAAAQAQTQSPYVGQEQRAIKTLSAQDVDDLLNGRGWGLAKAAELNGLPGPAHLLELKDEIGLTPGQVAAIEKLFAEMKAQAVPLGQRYVHLEEQLNQAFASRTITSDDLRAQLGQIAQVLGELRHVHLSTHLATPGILTPEQIAAYNRLRGYDLSAAGGMEGHHHAGH